MPEKLLPNNNKSPSASAAPAAAAKGNDDTSDVVKQDAQEEEEDVIKDLEQEKVPAPRDYIPADPEHSCKVTDRSPMSDDLT